MIPADDPIRAVKPIVEEALKELEPVFAGMYSEAGRRSIPPEHLLKACLLMAFYSIRSERQFCERLRYDLLFKWFLGLNVEDDAFDHSSFAKNRERLLKHNVSRAFFEAVLRQANRMPLLSSEHFPVDGTLLESWASFKSLQPRPNLGGQRKPKKGSRGRRGGGGGRNPEVDFRGAKQSNETHYSTTDPDARLARKGNGRSSCQDLWNSFQQELGASGQGTTSLRFEPAVRREGGVSVIEPAVSFRAKTRLPRFVTSNGTGTVPAASHAVLGSASLPTR